VSRGWRFHAKRYGAPAVFLLAVTVAVLLIRNGLRSDAAPSTTNEPAATVPSSTPAGSTTPVRRRQYYRLRQGETLSDVAIRFDTTVEQLLALNPGVQPTNLTVGQRIRVH
jgi:LysM repeat protein